MYLFVNRENESIVERRSLEQPRWITEKNAKAEDFDDLVQLCECALSVGDFPSEFEVCKSSPCTSIRQKTSQVP